MTKRSRKVRRTRRVERGTNWLLVGGVVGVGVVALLALLIFSITVDPAPTQTPVPVSLVDYCLDNPDNCIARGSADAPVTVVEVSDYGCGHCRNFNLDTAGLLTDLYVTPGDVQWVVMPYALGAGTTPAAEAALCAADQDRFFEFHHRMFERQSELASLTADGFASVAEEVGLDQEAFESCFEEGVFRNTVQRNIRAATSAGVRSTPSFFLNDLFLEGNYPLATFQQQINGLLGPSDAG